MQMNRICVFCGSSDGARTVYLECAREMGRALAARGIGLVYGGGRVGLMGALADEVLAGGGQVTGVIPIGLQVREVAHDRLTELRIVDSMHERKALMAELSDAFISLPGGLGTIEETAEMATWAQLGIHRKPSGLLNVAGYFDGLLAFLDHAVQEGFLSPANKALFVESTTVDGILDAVAAYAPPHAERWITRDET